MGPCVRMRSQGRQLKHHMHVGEFGAQLRRRAHPAIRVGSHNARIGNAIRITSRTRSVSTKGITPLKMVAKETSFTTLLMTKTFMPTGGWVRPSSTRLPIMNPHPNRTKPGTLPNREKNRPHKENLAL